MALSEVAGTGDSEPRAFAQRMANGGETETSEDRYHRLINNIPAAVLHVDSRCMAPVFANLRDAGIDDIRTYLRANPAVVEFSCQNVMVMEVNDAALDLLGATRPADLIGSVAYVFEQTPEAALNVIDAHFHEVPNHTQKIRIKKLDGSVLDAVLMVSFPRYRFRDDRTVLMLVDITEHARVERELKKIEAEFAHFARLSILAELSGAIVHEVKQPLSVVALDAETASRWLRQDEINIAKVRQLVARIEENARRANEVIRRVKDMASKAEPQREPHDLNELVREAVAFVSREARRRDVELVMKPGSGMPAITVDSVQIQQILVNLLVNAIQAIDEAGSRVRRTTIETIAEEGSAVVLVRDTGPGVPAELLDSVFESFFSTKQDGMGMGLSICRSIAAAHGGSISVPETGPLGTVFEIRIPWDSGADSFPGNGKNAR
ncbi:ATP-binding protein [Rhizobium sp. Leaf383]|uniref:sensor histidine kinase n=1 Tax=Rhizobium sp. Leaf383 TaxID=1736357 RepID=UPI000A9C9E9B|nr:ATP-binding protein [Rhizobium sp. Leaf383]